MADLDRRQLLILCTAMVSVSLTAGMVRPLTPLLSLALGAPPSLIGLLVSGAFLLPALLAIATGRLVDRWGARRLFSLGAFGLGLGPLAVALLPTLPSLALSQVLFGLSFLAISLSSQSLVAATGSGRAREQAFGWYTTAIAFGQLIGPLLAGILVDGQGFQVAFAAAGSNGLLALALTRALKEPGPSRAQPSAQTWHRTRDLLARPGVRLSLLVSFGLLFAVGGYRAFLPVHLELLAFSATSIGLFLSLLALAALAVRPLMSHVVRLFRGRIRTMLGMLALVAAGIAITGFVYQPLLLVAAMLLIGIGTGIVPPVTMVTVVDHAGGGARGTALGIRLTGNRTAQLISPLLFGLLAEVAGIGLAFIVSAATLVLLAPFILRLRPSFERAERRLARS